MKTNQTIIELRATIGVRILVDRVELESHPSITLDGNADRRSAWQSIASAAVDRFLPGADAELPPAPPKKKRGRPKKQRPPKPTPARFIVRTTDDAEALLAIKPTLIDDTRFACVVCARSFEPLPKHRGRQRTCGRERCQKTVNNARARVERANRGAAS